MRNNMVHTVQMAFLAGIIWMIVFLSFTVERIEQKLDALQQTTTVEDAPASGGEGA